MNINRHNYETFFLLYVDNELSAAERKAVELFVRENPDLQIELSLLQDTVLRADDVVLDKKDWLYVEDGISSLQEKLLMYADAELDEADNRAVEALIVTDKAASAEWDLLRRTKLEADTSVVFEDKRSLYRKEEGRVVAIRWWRVAAAAVLLGFGLWTGIAVYKNGFTTTTTTGGEVADAGKNGKAGQETGVQTNNNGPTGVNGINAARNDAGTTSIASVPGNTDQTSGAGDKSSNANEVKNRNKNNAETNNNGFAVKEEGNKKEDNNLPKPNFENINRTESNLNTFASVKPENNISTSGVNGVVVKTNPVISDPATATAAIPVVYTDGDTNNDRYLYMDEDKVKRTKLGGFIRKAKRLLERNANIKTGDGLKVAGFEIALK